MATYLANNAARDTVIVTLSRQEALALLEYATTAYDSGMGPKNGQVSKAADRAMDALSAATNPSARRAGFFD